MAAFEKIKSGISGLDGVLDSIRLGDNVVWQVSDIKQYMFFAQSLARQAIKDKRCIIYIRFAQHKPLLNPQPGLLIEKLDAGKGFESFTVAVHAIIKKRGRQAFYIFDSISELQAAWSADLMMGNFFVVTCPYLFELDTVAYFGIIRERHSFDTIARIRETTQILIDVYSEKDEIYLHPLKVWKRYSNTMFLPHRFDKNNPDNFKTLSGGLDTSRFYSIIESNKSIADEQNLDNWDRFFLHAKLNAGTSGRQDVADICERLLGADKKLNCLILDNFTARDLIAVKERMIGSGKIGGKAAGMLLARKIIENTNPGLSSIFEPHDSFYIGSDVYYTYLVQNDCWKLRLLQKDQDNYFPAAKLLKEKILAGIFPDNTREQFRRMLEYYGQNPIIVRSSSLLEDSFANAFAGKYESVFCINSGSLNERLEEFEKAVKQVYASTMDKSALEYRFKRGLSKSDEQMAILVQRVSGLNFSGIFMPCAAGVGYSYNSYKWHKDIDPAAGMIRIVMGLGTRAVERTEGDYPRIASLANPQLTTLTSSSEKSQYSQHIIDVLDLGKKSFAQVSLYELSPKLPLWYKRVMIEHDREAERILEKQDNKKAGKPAEIIYSTCDGLLKIPRFTDSLKQIMAIIQKHYEYPVDIEFTCNFTEQGDFLLNLLQCRPLQVGGFGAEIKIPCLDDKNIFFELSGATMGGPVKREIDKVIQIDPAGYFSLAYRQKSNIARIIGKLNQHFRQKNTVMLLVPGRIGTTSPETGISVTFAEISNINIICEVPYREAGYMPELSFGSHFFNDLIEAGVFYAGIFEGKSTKIYNAGFLGNMKNILVERCSDCSQYQDIIKVYDTSGTGLSIYSDLISGRTVCGI
ncbi:MAG: phosphoenolpyruvate synthase, partial [Actinobacteria bacterium]|nr:phosphoenolpyruvate synthase [Actinomycetota bacterium]